MRVRAAASLVLVVIMAAVLAGCTLFLPPETQQPYNPSDGINANVGELQLRNVMVVTTDGGDGNLLMVVVNASDKKISFKVQYESNGAKVDVPLTIGAHETIQYGTGDGGQLLLTGIDVVAGGLLPIYVQYGTVPGLELLVPVLDGTQEEYSDLAPTPVPIPTPTPTPTPTETPAA